MALREYIDPGRRVWRVWSTIPTPRGAPGPGTDLGDAPAPNVSPPEPAYAHGHVTPGLEHGWLTFQAGDDKRRLSPIPPGWDVATDAELAGYLARAVPVHLNPAAARILRRAEPT